MPSDVEDEEDMPSGNVFNCAEMNDAIEAATELSGASDAPTDPKTSYEQSRAALVALRDSAPEIADDIDTAVGALDDFAGVMERYDWETDFSDDPAQAFAFGQEILSQGNVLEMSSSLSAVGAWIASNCAGG